MYCEKCGSKIEDGAVFCSVCGNAVNASGGQETTNARPTMKVPDTEKNSKIGKVAFACIAVLVVVGIVGILRATGVVGGKGYKKVVDTYFKAAFDGESSLILDIIPEEVIEYVMEEEGMTRSEVRMELVDELDDLVDSLNKYYGTSWSYEYKVLMYDDYEDSYMEIVQEDFEDMYGIEISQARSVIVYLKLSLDDQEATQFFTIEVGKIGSKWYYIGEEGQLVTDGALF